MPIIGLMTMRVRSQRTVQAAQCRRQVPYLRLFCCSSVAAVLKEASFASGEPAVILSLNEIDALRLRISSKPIQAHT